MYINDFKYAIRLLSKKPGFTLLTILVMAVGIGLSLYLLSFVHTMATKPLPFKDSESLIIFNSYQKGINDYGQKLDLHDYYQIRTTLKGVSEFGAFKNINVNVSGRDGTRRRFAIAAEPNIFEITRTQPLLGRGFKAADNQVGAKEVVVISYDLWQSQFSGDEAVIGESIRINGSNHQVIGVMPEGYGFPDAAEMWLPMREDATQLKRGQAGSYFGMAHLDKGFNKEDIDHQLSVIMQWLEKKHPETNSGLSAYVGTLQNSMGTRGQDGAQYAMYTVAVLILILASVNVGNLLLSRAIERGKETAIRVSLGAPRSRLISQFLWESVIICTVGGIIGLLMVAWGLEVTNTVVAAMFFNKPVFWWIFALDGYTVTLFFGFVLSTILVTGVLPAWRNSGTNFNAVLRDGTRGALGKKTGRLNRLVVVSEIFLSMMIMISAATILAGHYLDRAYTYVADTENTLMAKVLLPESSYPSPEEITQFTDRLQSNLENSTGVGDVMISTALPSEWADIANIALEGKEYNTEKRYPRANYIKVTPGTLAKLNIELKQGRYFNSADNDLGGASVIVTDSFVAQHFPHESPLGNRIQLVKENSKEAQWLTIVGVVENTLQGEPNEDIAKIPSVFRAFAQDPSNQINIAIQMLSDKDLAVHTLRKTIQSIDPGLPAFQVETYADLIKRLRTPGSFLSTVFVLFGIAAIVLAASGIYGVMSNVINQRTQEIGIKRALGAWDERITREFLYAGAKQLLWGAIPGLLAGAGMGFVMAKALGGNTVSVIFCALSAFVLVAFIVMLASWLPTRQALLMEPSDALHYE